MSEVEIPERAYDAAWGASMGAGNFPMTNALEYSATIIGAEYLRKSAREHWFDAAWLVPWLMQQADELDPPEAST